MEELPASFSFREGALFHFDRPEFRANHIDLNGEIDLCLSHKNLTARDAIKISKHKIPTWELKRSAITPRTKGATPNPKVVPIETITPMAIARSERVVNERYEGPLRSGGGWMRI